MPSADQLLAATGLTDFKAPATTDLLQERRWRAVSKHDRTGAVCEFVRNTMLLEALLRGAGVLSRLRAFINHRALQRGVVPELVYPIAPFEIVHSWVKVEMDGQWVELEGFILDATLPLFLQRAFSGNGSLYGYGGGTECPSAPPVEWAGDSICIQMIGIARDLGTLDSPDATYLQHRQDFGRPGERLYRRVIWHWLNARVHAIRCGNLPRIPELGRTNHCHGETPGAA